MRKYLYFGFVFPIILALFNASESESAFLMRIRIKSRRQYNVDLDPKHCTNTGINFINCYQIIKQGLYVLTWQETILYFKGIVQCLFSCFQRIDGNFFNKAIQSVTAAVLNYTELFLELCVVKNSRVSS
jgi:hypothetical protein